MENGVRGRELASRRNKKAQYFPQPFFNKSTLLSSENKAKKTIYPKTI